MTMSQHASRMGMGGFTRILSLVVVAALVLAAVLLLIPQQEKRYLTAHFPRTVSLYEGSDVRILGVPVGEVTSVTPTGTDVTVKLWYDPKYKVPADAQAVIITPAIVGDRFIQLTPVYTGGPALADGATLTTESTSTPLELDEIYQSIDDLTVALGPEGANKEGALTRLLDATAENFAGQGEQFNQTIQDLGKLTGTLDNNKEELFGTARQLERFVSALAENDQTVRAFNQSLAGAAEVLEGERDDLAASLRNLGIAMEAVSGFVRENRSALSENIDGLNRVTRILVRQRDALDEVLTVAPLALNNLFLTYNPATGTLDTRSNQGELEGQIEANPAAFLCGLVSPNDPSGEACGVIEQALGGARSRAAALDTRDGAEKKVPVEHIDRSLAGLVEVD
jgi:phospholipid/cholesterol/gamma-HCH transport system substrate-binding protein